MKKLLLISLILTLTVLLFHEGYRQFLLDPESNFAGAKRFLKDDSKTIEPLKKKLHSFSLNAKKHYYDPKHTLTRSYPNSPSRIKLAWQLEPFEPTPKEFQYIAQYEASMEHLSEVVDEEAFFTPEGRALYAKEATRFEKNLKSQLGKNRYDRYEYVFSPKSGYSNAWRLLKVNGIDTSRVGKLQELAIRYNREVLGEASLDMRENITSWIPPDNEDEIKELYRIKIKQQFGKQVLFDIMALKGHGLFSDLDFDNIDDLDSYKAEGYKDPWDDRETALRILKEYNTQLGKGNDDEEDSVPGYKKMEEMHQREMEFQEKHQEEFNKIMQLTSQEPSTATEVPPTKD